MAEKKPQNFSNHRRFVPLFHYVLSSMLLLNLVWAGWRLFKAQPVDNIVAFVTAVALLILFYYARDFPLHVQDRLIRLEERMHLSEVLPPELAGRVMELTPSQLIGLRFASDAELAELVPKVLDGELEGREEIKRAIKSWKPDYYRC